MKKYYLLFFILSVPFVLSAQWYGDGLSSSTAYYGVINSSYPMQNWNITNYPGGVIYVGQSATGQNDLEVGTGGTLTISQGITVKFCTTASDLRISGTGILDASGSSSSYVTFTKDVQASWGHIIFTGSGESQLKYSLIKFGDVRSGSTNYDRAGGALLIRTSSVTVSNTIISNCKAEFGGAVFVDASCSPLIKNCRFTSNESNSAGGGIYLYTGSGSLIENCIFEFNACKEASNNAFSGGGICAQNNTTVKVINCTFVKNTTTRSSGSALEFYSSNSALAINCILWGDNIPYYLSGTNGNTIQNCAIQFNIPSGSVNCIILNSSNTNSAGPNFVAEDGTDWSIKYVSPCRDAGTTPSPTVPNDYLGNPRVLNYDIGAYEVQYSRWKITAATTDWGTDANWDGGVPTITRDVIIPTGASKYPTGLPTQDFTIGSGKQMIIEQGARVTLNDLTNNGIIKLNHIATGFSSLIINSYSRGSGATEEIQLYLSGGGSSSLEDYKWHYISTPVSSVSTNIFTGVTSDLAQYIESRPSYSLLQGWVAFDGYEYVGGSMTGFTFNSLTPGKGYDFWDNANNTFIFGGMFNTSNVVMALSYSGEPATMHGFNLLGNPFSSGLNWNDITNSVYVPYPSNTSKGVYFTRNNLQCTYIGGVGIPTDVSGIIPPMQGFFTKTYSSGNSITLPAAARTHDNIHARYKGEEIIPLVRLAVFEDTVLNDETVVRFNEGAKSDLDNDFDAVKMFLSSTATTINTSLGGIDYAINGQPFPGATTVLEIPVVVNVTTTGNHKISTTQLQGLDLYDVSLKDNTTGFLTDLKTTPNLTFSSSAGLLSNRFVLIISGSTGIENPAVSAVKFNIWQGSGFINIKLIADEWDGRSGSVKVFDMSGKTVSDLQNILFSKNSVWQVHSPAANGLYFIEIISGLNRFVGKVVIN